VAEREALRDVAATVDTVAAFGFLMMFERAAV
jgi:hypothetical protein